MDEHRFGTIGFVDYRKTPVPAGWPGSLFPDRVEGDKEQWVFAFPNGYGASVITGWGAYGTPASPYELAVLHGDDGLCYATPLTNDVMGYLTVDEVNKTLNAIMALPERADCSHAHKDDDE